MWCLPAAESLQIRRSALKALESNIRELAYPCRDEQRTGEGGPALAAPPMRPAAAVGGPKPQGPARAAAKSEPQRTTAASLRKRITPYQSRKIAASQNFLCAICHKPFSQDNLWDIDHIVPLQLCALQGGTKEACNDPSNLRAIHRTCHADITSRQFMRPGT